MASALITGITGQDGAYLSRLLLDKGYRVTGTIHADRPDHFASLEAFGIRDKIEFIPAGFSSDDMLKNAVEVADPDEIYHLAAPSSVAESWQHPIETGEIGGLGAARLLEAWRTVKPQARFFQASSADMFGTVTETPQTETTPFHPQSPYGAAKAYAHWMAVNYRRAYGAHVSCGILFNHESPLRPEQFVTRKVTLAAARIKHGLQAELVLGNLDVQRDWGFAGDYVQAMWRMLQQGAPDDYIIATGVSHSLREFVDLAFQCVGLDYQAYVRSDPAFYRPAEPTTLMGSPRKIAAQVGWSPRLSFAAMVELLVDADIKRVLNQPDSIRYT